MVLRVEKREFNLEFLVEEKYLKICYLYKIIYLEYRRKLCMISFLDVFLVIFCLLKLCGMVVSFEMI